jgi:hypothetical protein
MNNIPTYSLWWLWMHHDLLRQVGDIEYLKEQKEYMVALTKRLLPLVDEEGCEHLPPNRFLDWPNNANDEAKHAGLQGILKITFECCADMLYVLDEAELAEECAKTAARMKNHVPTCGGSKQGASMLALSGIADPKEINEKHLAPGGALGYSTFFGYYLLKAKALAGDFVGALNDIREYWGAMLDMGATTFWEDFNLEWLENSAPIDEIVPEGKRDIHGDFGAYCYTLFRHSLCHGWSSGLISFVVEHIIGLKVTDTGVEFNPNTYGIENINAVLFTKHGKVSVEIKNGNATYKYI